jgi:uncharacterized protein Yka (UPF0111/DUF47 family)
MKAQILDALGETSLDRSTQLNTALAANDRLKFYFSLLQMSLAHADDCEQSPVSLKAERLACGIEDPRLDETIAASRREGRHYVVPNCAGLLRKMAQDLRIMAEPLAAQGAFQDRLKRLVSSLPKPQDDAIEGAVVHSITQAGRAGADSIHQLVMDMHKALNAMQSQIADERLDGASVYGIEADDRPLIAAFMAGLNRTAPLKFDHPGLATTATRAGKILVIQNDIGTTDAHVIVIHVEGLVVEITYSDVHPERVEFLRNILRRFKATWGEDRTRQSPALAEGATFYLAAGRFEAKDRAELLAYLDFLGSRLVFLIDWNRARKQLRGFLRGPQRDAALAWAADSEVGHRAFLELGGARLINEAIESVGGSAMHFGDRLCDVLGDEPTQAFVQFVLRAAMEGLREHQSPTLIEERLHTELQTHFRSEGSRLLRIAGDQAGLILEIASLLSDGIRSIGSDPDVDRYVKMAKRARRFEHDADQLVVSVREAVRRRSEYTPLFRLVETADDAADELEEAVFLMELLAESKAEGEALQALGSLADLLVETAREWIKALSHAAGTYSPPTGLPGARRDTDDFLIAIDRMCELEHSADNAERALIRASVQRARDFRQLHMYAEMGRSLEAASDALKWSGLIARDHLLGTDLKG